VDALAQVQKDKTFFDAAPASIRSCQGADALVKYFEALNDVMIIARVLNPDNAAQPSGDGLYVQRGFVKAPEKKPDPNAPQIPQIDPFSGKPIGPVPPQEQVEVGVLTAVVSQGGLDLIGGAGQASKVKIHPNKPLIFTVEVRKPGALQSQSDKRQLPPNTADVWGLIRWLSTTSNRSFQVLGVGFGIDASPSLPAVWPVRRTFGLPD
jgi:hypothetical protein